MKFSASIATGRMLADPKDFSDNSPNSERRIAPVPFPNKALNVNASVFEPIIRGRSQLRASAAEFVPSSGMTTSAESSISAEIISIVENAGCLGVNMIDLLSMYQSSRGKPLDISSSGSSDISMLIRSISELRIKNSRAVPDSIREAMLAAGFRDPQSGDDPEETMGCRDNGHVRSRNVVTPPIPSLLGADYDKVIVHVRFEKYVDELRTFRESIVEVISSFMTSTTDPATGLSLSLFPSEWDKFFISKGLPGMPGFKALRERFSVVKLMTFFQSIPGLDIIGAHPEVRVKVLPTQPTRSLVLSNELPSRPSLDIQQHISPPLVSQLVTQVDRQVLELGSFLATKGPQMSSQDLVLIRLQLQQLHCLKTSLQAVLRPLPITQVVRDHELVLPPATKTAVVSGPSTAATSRKASPQMSPSHKLTQADFVNMIYRVIEKACSDQQSALFADPNPCNIGIPVNRIKDDWSRRYPSLHDFNHYATTFQVLKLKDFLLQTNLFGDSLVLFFATLPSPQLRVSTRAHYIKFFKPDHPSANLISLVSRDKDDSSSVPLISPSSTCSYTSDQVGNDIDDSQRIAVSSSLDTNRMITELVLKKVRQEQVAIIERKAMVDKRYKFLVEIFKLVEATKGVTRPLDSRRPPPIDTGSGTGGKSNSSFPLMKNFIDFVTLLIISEHLFGGPSDVVGLPVAAWAATWKSEYPNTPVVDPKVLSHVPGIRISAGSDGIRKCTVAALSTPSAAIASLFNVADKSIWNGENKRLIELVTDLVSSAVPKNQVASTSSTTTNQLSELSSVIFKSIMSGGPVVARQCATALRILAAHDPKAIHEIVSNHVACLKNTPSESAAEKLIKSLISRSNELDRLSKVSTRTKTDELRKMMGIVVADDSRVYSKHDLLWIRKGLSTSSTPPSELVNLRLCDRSK